MSLVFFRAGKFGERYLRYYIPLILAIVMGFLSPGPARAVDSENLTFHQKLQSFRDRALEEGISSSLLDRTLKDLRPDSKVLDNLRNQPEFTMDYARYRKLFLTESTVVLGRKKLESNGKLLRTLETDYGVPGEILVAVWGVESRYGRHRSGYDAVNSISTLAFGESGRNEYFQGELLSLLRILQQGLIPRSSLRSSWAGAMGEPQFMPSSYLSYAVDYDGDGYRNLWESREDILASIANYLSEHGWEEKLPWGWPESEKVDVDVDTRLLQPEGWSDSFVVTPNFEVIKRYNPSNHYALVVGELSNRIGERKTSN